MKKNLIGINVGTIIYLGYNIRKSLSEIILNKILWLLYFS